MENHKTREEGFQSNGGDMLALPNWLRNIVIISHENQSVVTAADIFFFFPPSFTHSIIFMKTSRGIAAYAFPWQCVHSISTIQLPFFTPMSYVFFFGRLFLVCLCFSLFFWHFLIACPTSACYNVCSLMISSSPSIEPLTGKVLTTNYMMVFW